MVPAWTMMETPQWWLQPDSTCRDCITRAPSTRAPSLAVPPTMSRPLLTTSPTAQPDLTASSADGGDSGGGAIIAIVVILVLLCGAIVGVVLKRRHNAAENGHGGSGRSRAAQNPTYSSPDSPGSIDRASRTFMSMRASKLGGPDVPVNPDQPPRRFSDWPVNSDRAAAHGVSSPRRFSDFPTADLPVTSSSTGNRRMSINPLFGPIAGPHLPVTANPLVSTATNRARTALTSSSAPDIGMSPIRGAPAPRRVSVFSDCPSADRGAPAPRRVRRVSAFSDCPSADRGAPARPRRASDC